VLLTFGIGIRIKLDKETMQEKITVTIFKSKQRPNFLAQWVDPKTGRKQTKSTGTKIKREAQRFVGQLEGKLNSGEYHKKERNTWKDFRGRYEKEALSGLSRRTNQTAATSFNCVERIINPKYLSSVNSDSIGKMIRTLREEQKSESTIKGYLIYVGVALRWAHRNKILNEVPVIDMPKRTSKMKGRPITTEEFERMLEKVPEVVGDKQAESWRCFLKGLWWSGLRLGEAIKLHWTDDRLICVDFTNRRPFFRIKAKADKGNKERLLPMAPEFAEFLNSIPEDDQLGYVFNPLPQRNHISKMRADTISKRISAIGKAAGVKVSESAKGKPLYASAHDLRRSFGSRWSLLVMPAVLKELMRHESISTTMQFYVGRNAEETAEVIWFAAAKHSAKHGTLETSDGEEESTEPITDKALKKSRRRDSNSRPTRYECVALPTELQRLIKR
jgi:integrase